MLISLLIEEDVDAFEMLDEYFDEFADGVIQILLEDVDDWFER